MLFLKCCSARKLSQCSMQKNKNKKIIKNKEQIITLQEVNLNQGIKGKFKLKCKQVP